MIDLIGGPGRDRTDDLFHAMEARSQLRHRPTLRRVATSLLSTVKANSSNFGSYRNGTLRQLRVWGGFGSALAFHKPVLDGPMWGKLVEKRVSSSRGEENVRDREHLRGYPVSKTMERIETFWSGTGVLFPRTPWQHRILRWQGKATGDM